MPHSSSALSIYIAAVLEPSEEPGEKFRVASAPIDRISLVQRLITGSFAAADPYATTILSLNAWALGHLPDLVCGDKSHSNLKIRGRWWKAYTRTIHMTTVIIPVKKTHQANFWRLPFGTRHTSHSFALLEP
ncbi:hypothetical protein M407DRAFT_13153 [Tulasnella calospora MUT 4182]|uniref:Uncharacterized protein n=1 Tax=Tulasnella calospora MUT 4182 TaxID=1051891 RepID=A0A0C3K2V1_9AGAM|nr:hypothetical protein M407DRAFT_13153 [Tulasnella calospora MUT 4182]